MRFSLKFLIRISSGFAALPMLLAQTACRDPLSEAETSGEGTLRVWVYQSGLLPDPEIEVLVDGEVAGEVEDALRVNGGVATLTVAAGSHSVSLTGLQSNCEAASSSVPATVQAGRSTVVNLQVSCRGDEIISQRKAAVVLGSYPGEWANSTQQSVGSMDAAGVFTSLHPDAWTMSMAPDHARFAVVGNQGNQIVEAGATRRLGESWGKAIAWAPQSDAVAAIYLDAATCSLHIWEGPAWDAARVLSCGPGLGDLPSLDIWPRYDGDLSWSPDEKSIVVGTARGDVTLVSLETGETAPLPGPGHTHQVIAVAWSPSGREIAVAADCDSCATKVRALIIDATSRTVSKTLEWQGKPVPLAWIREGTQMILGSRLLPGPATDCTVTQIVALDSPEDWRPLTLCGSTQLVRIEIP